jgi:predicted Zn finger-like uncharacterized protein
MRLSCPSCQTQYDVPDQAVAGRSRTLRCAQCGYQWVFNGAAALMAAPVNEAPISDVPAATLPDAESAPPPAMAAAPFAVAPALAELAVPEPVAPRPHAFAEPVAEPAPVAAFSWAAPPAAPVGWPSFAAEQSSLAEPPPLPASVYAPPDDEAGHEDAAPAALQVEDTAVLAPLSEADFQPAAPAETDRFAALVTAARRKSLEYEPLAPVQRGPVRTSNTKLFVTLVVLFVLGMTVLERHFVMHAVPASAKIFHAVGLA